MENPRFKQTVKIGYGTRIGMTVMLVGGYVDMLVGLVAVGLGSAVIRQGTSGGAFNEDAPWWMFFMITIIQGVLLNIGLFGYMAIVYFLSVAFSRR